MNLKLKKAFGLLIIILFVGTNISAQINLKGKVQDINSSEPLIGASVTVIGTSLGTATAQDGTFSIKWKNYL